MSLYYLDSSAVVKRYFPEVGSTWIQELTAPAVGHTIVTSEISLVEVAAAISARRRAPHGITQQERDQAIALVLRHGHTEYQLAPVNRLVIQRAIELTTRHRLRGYDAVQLATALLLETSYTAANLPRLTFLAADIDLLDAAQAEGLVVDNPSRHG